MMINSDEWVEVWESFRTWIHDDKIMKVNSGGQGWEYWYTTIDDVCRIKQAVIQVLPEIRQIWTLALWEPWNSLDLTTTLQHQRQMHCSL